MRLLQLLSLPLAALLFFGCGGGPEAASDVIAFTPVTVADSVAAAHGFDKWKDVERLDFTFAVDVADTNRVSREWTWFPKSDSVVASGPDGRLAYVRGAALDSAALAADANFINDTYWLLMPFYLVWSGDGYESSVTYRDTMPLSGDIGTRLTVQYRPTGGYTPGDAYDLYVDGDYLLQEWTFRKGGAEAPSMILDWRDYETVGGIVVPTDHRGEGPVRIYHPGTEVASAR